MASHYCSKNVKGSVLGFDLASKGRGSKVLYNMRHGGEPRSVELSGSLIHDLNELEGHKQKYKKEKAERAQDALENPFEDPDDVLEIEEEVDPKSLTAEEVANLRKDLEDQLLAEEKRQMAEARRAMKIATNDKVGSDAITSIVDRIGSSSQGDAIEHKKPDSRVQSLTGGSHERIDAVLGRVNEGKFHQAPPSLSEEQLNESARRFAEKQKSNEVLELSDDDIEFVERDTIKHQKNLPDALRMGAAKGRFEGVQTRRTRDEDNIVEALQMSSAGGRFEGVQSAEIHPGVQRLKEKSRSQRGDTHKDVDEQLGNWQEWNDPNSESQPQTTEVDDFDPLVLEARRNSFDAQGKGMDFETYSKGLKDEARDLALSYEQQAEVVSNTSSTLQETVTPATESNQTPVVEENVNVTVVNEPSKKKGFLSGLRDNKVVRWVAGIGALLGLTKVILSQESNPDARSTPPGQAAKAPRAEEGGAPAVSAVSEGFDFKAAPTTDTPRPTTVRSSETGKGVGSPSIEAPVGKGIDSSPKGTVEATADVAPRVQASERPAFRMDSPPQGSAEAFVAVDPYIAGEMKVFESVKSGMQKHKTRSGETLLADTKGQALYSTDGRTRFGHHNGKIETIAIQKKGSSEPVILKVESGKVQDKLLQQKLEDAQRTLDFMSVRF